MNENLKLKLKVELKKVLDNNLIYALPLHFFIGGSSCLDFIKDANNINIIAVYKESESSPMYDIARDAIENIAEKNNLDISFINMDEPTIYDYLYSVNYINIFGSDKIIFNLFENKDKVKSLMQIHYNKCMESHNIPRLFDVVYYYFLIKNDKYELYPYQKLILNNWHNHIYDIALLRKAVNELGLVGGESL